MVPVAAADSRAGWFSVIEVVPVHLASDFDALRPRMITHPSAQVEGVALSPTGDRVAVQARGYISVFPVGAGRRVDVVSDSAQRARDLTFSADGKSLYFVSDATGELEFWQVPTNGSARPTPLTKGSEAALGDPSVSPDGSTLAYRDAMRQVWLRAGKPVALFQSKTELTSALKALAEPGDVVLLKGARSYSLDQLLTNW